MTEVKNLVARLGDGDSREKDLKRLSVRQAFQQVSNKTYLACLPLRPNEYMHGYRGCRCPCNDLVPCLVLFALSKARSWKFHVDRMGDKRSECS